MTWVLTPKPALRIQPKIAAVLKKTHECNSLGLCPPGSGQLLSSPGFGSRSKNGRRTCATPGPGNRRERYKRPRVPPGIVSARTWGHRHRRKQPRGRALNAFKTFTT